VATPMILPVPMVAARAIISALKWLISPTSFALDRTKVSRSACLSIVTWMPRKRTVRKMPVPTRSTSKGIPQTYPLAAAKKLFNCSISHLPQKVRRLWRSDCIAGSISSHGNESDILEWRGKSMYF